MEVLGGRRLLMSEVPLYHRSTRTFYTSGGILYRLGPYGVPTGVALSYERGVPVQGLLAEKVTHF